MNIRVIDDFVNPGAMWDLLISGLEFSSRTFGEDTFHGISESEITQSATMRIGRMFPAAHHLVSFFRKSPAGQIEPNDIHTDAEMGDWTGILYLNHNPHPGDGTVFWRQKGGPDTGEIWKVIGHDRSQWDEVCRVPAKFNRLLLFDAKLYHSRAIVENYGQGDDARLIQVIFGKGEIPWQ